MMPAVASPPGKEFYNMSKMNLPNRLTLLRVILVPVFVACMLYIPNAIVNGFVSCAVFALASLTDMLDGKIARKYNLITNFGKFMDSLADKFMIFAALVVLTVIHPDPTVRHVLIWVTLLVIFRELAVTSIRLVCQQSAGKVIAANYFGKIKAVVQMVCIIVMLLEPSIRELFDIDTLWIPSYVLIAAMAVLTLASGIDYFKTYLPYMDSNK